MDPFHPDSDAPGGQGWVEGFLDHLPHTRAIGIRPLEVARGRVSLVLPARPEWLGDPARGRTHTGCLGVLADTTCGITAGSALETPGPFATLDLRMDYLRSAQGDLDLVCSATCERLSRSVAFVRGEVRQPGRDELVACATATFMRTRPTGGGPAEGPRSAVAPALLPAVFRPSPEVLAAAARAQEPALPPGRSPYVDYLDLRQLATEAGPIFRLPFRPDMVGNPAVPALHGGILAALGETAMMLHLAATTPGAGGRMPEGVDFAIDYLRSARATDTFAQALTVRRGARVSLVQGFLWQEDPLRPVAAVRGHALLPVGRAR